MESSRGNVFALADLPEPNAEQRRADALVRVAERSLSGSTGSRTADRYQVRIHVDAATLADPEASGRCEVEDGPSLCAQSVRRLTCDGSLVSVLHDGEGGVLNVGRKTRVIASALRRAMQTRDEGCCFPGCHSRFVDGHHLEHWVDGGETKLDNLFSVCRRHHRLLHEGGFGVRLAENGELVFTTPDGERLAQVVAPPQARENAVVALARSNREAGHPIEPETNLPNWEGDPPQYEYIAEVLAHLEAHRLAAPN